jgi:hypothetical protein
MADAPKPGAGETGKGGQSTLLLKKGGVEDDAGGDAKPKKVLKPAPSSGRSLGRAVIAASVIVTIGWIYASISNPRYVMQSIQSGENAFIYRLDQRTGAVHFCSTQACSELAIK